MLYMKKIVKKQKTKPEYILPVKDCMGYRCRYSRYIQYRPDDKQMLLVCGLINTATIDLNSCPRGLWVKDAEGRLWAGDKDKQTVNFKKHTAVF